MMLGGIGWYCAGGVWSVLQVNTQYPRTTLIVMMTTMPPVTVIQI